MYLYINIYVCMQYTYSYICTFIYIFIYIYVNIFTHLHIYIHIHIHIHIYIHIYNCLQHSAKVSSTLILYRVCSSKLTGDQQSTGFLGTCPSNLGTGLRASVMIKIPELNKDPHALEAVCDAFDLQVKCMFL